MERMLRRHTMRYHRGQYHGKLGYLQAFSALCIDGWSSWVWASISCGEARSIAQKDIALQASWTLCTVFSTVFLSSFIGHLREIYGIVMRGKISKAERSLASESCWLSGSLASFFPRTNFFEPHPDSRWLVLSN